MAGTDHTTSEARERAALYALGALEDAQRRDFEEHLQSGCAFCRDEVESFRPIVEEISMSGSPSQATKECLLQRISTGENAEPPVIEQPGLRFVRGDRTVWQLLDVPGVEIKLLSVDAERDCTTQLVYMAPGATYPDHRHGGTEDLYVLQGDLEVSGVSMKTGDYCRAEAGSLHTCIRSQNGCVFLSTTSVHDQRLV